MPVDIVVGTQWGDEGKGRVVDLFSAGVDYVARFNGGDNAGHTVTVGNNVFKLHLIPSGIIKGDAVCVLGNGVVINPRLLVEEIDYLKDYGIEVNPDNLKISERAHLVTDDHIIEDEIQEDGSGDARLGTTRRGIGPTYTSKAERTGLRAISLGNSNLWGYYGERLAPFLCDTSYLLNMALLDEKSILAEGAQGTMLDLDHGTYPYVTSSTSTSGGAMTGLGIGPKWVGEIVGVAKAFSSRVGYGPFPSEVDNNYDLELLRGNGDNPWDEFGTTTGRARRVGWLDIPILRYAARVNGLTQLFLTKLDILTGMKKIPVCVAYEVNLDPLEAIGEVPTSVRELASCKPIYSYLDGWEEDISSIRDFNELPINARRYIAFIESTVGTPVSWVSVGPQRKQYIATGVV